jgi:hypothetical protein
LQGLWHIKRDTSLRTASLLVIWAIRRSEAMMERGI